MKRSSIILLAIAFTFVSCISINHTAAKISYTLSKKYKSSHTVVIDAGHGGRDNGTSAADNTREKDINLAISSMLYDYLAVCGIDCIMTRYDDYQVYNDGDDTTRSDLYNRLDIVNSIDNAILISIHQNHFTDTAEWGMQIWYSPNNTNSNILANSISCVNMQLLCNTNNRQNKESNSDYYILYNAQKPSIMVECGFMSNVNENNKLKTALYQNQLAFAIMVGYQNYLGSNNYG